MRYGYDLTNRADREMYLQMKKKDFERVNKNLTLQEAYNDLMKQRQ